MERVDSQDRHFRELAEDSQPQGLSDELEEGSKLTDITEQNEDSRSQDPNEQCKAGIQIRLETPEQQSSEEREDSRTPVSGSWGKTSTDWVDDSSSFLTLEPSTSSYFRSSDTSRPEDTQDSLETPELSETLSLWGKTKTEWKFERPGHPVPKQKPSFHRHCCNSAIEETIKHSPRKLAKSSCVRGFIQERRPPSFKRREIIPPYERIRKQRLPVGLQRKEEAKGFFKAHPHMTGLCEGSGSHLGRKSKALHNLYTTFSDEEVADPSFLQRTEGSSAASGLSRACAMFSVLKKGRINVSNLLLTLHTMGILVARADMHRALKNITVDERGNLNFLEFLNVVSLTTPFAGTKALQKARQVFRKLKKDMVAVEDLEPTLACLGVTLSPTIIKQALRRIQITWDWKLNISDFLATVRRLQSRCDKMAYPDVYPLLNWRSLGDVNDMNYSELRWGRKCSLDREMPAAHRIPIITFCSAEEAIAFTERQRQTSKPQRPVDLKRPSTASPVCPAEENKKKKPIIKWPKARLGCSYTSQDTSFPLESTLCRKATERAPVQAAETKANHSCEDSVNQSCEDSVNQSCEDSPPLFTPPNLNFKVKERKKKALSFSHELPKRYSTEDSSVPVFTQLETGGKGSSEDPSAPQPLQ